MGHAHKEIYLHLVWATLRREPLLSEEAERRVHRCLQSEAERMRCVVLAVGGMPDHVHLAVQMPSSVCAAQIVKQLKGASSRPRISIRGVPRSLTPLNLPAHTARRRTRGSYFREIFRPRLFVLR